MYIKTFAGKQLDFNMQCRHSFVNNSDNGGLSSVMPYPGNKAALILIRHLAAICIVKMWYFQVCHSNNIFYKKKCYHGYIIYY